jgi:hypothetical protein
MFLMRGSSALFARMTPEEIQQAIEKYNAWAQSLMSKGRLKGGEKLQDDGVRTVRMDKGKLTVDGPFPETKETIGGYFIVEAADYAEAIELAKGCPVYSAGGSVEVRGVDSHR